MRLLRMDPRAGVYRGCGWLTPELFRNLQCALHLVRAFADADGEDRAHAGGLRARQNLGQIAGEHVEVRVRVGQMHRVTGPEYKARDSRGMAMACNVRSCTLTPPPPPNS